MLSSAAVRDDGISQLFFFIVGRAGERFSSSQLIFASEEVFGSVREISDFFLALNHIVGGNWPLF